MIIEQEEPNEHTYKNVILSKAKNLLPQVDVFRFFASLRMTI